MFMCLFFGMFSVSCEWDVLFSKAFLFISGNDPPDFTDLSSGDGTYASGDGRFACAVYDAGDRAAMRVSELSDDSVRHFDLVCDKNSHVMSVWYGCSFEKPSDVREVDRTVPEFVRRMIWSGLCVTKFPDRVSHGVPYLLRSSDVCFMDELLSGKTALDAPVIYVPCRECDTYGSYCVDYGMLAQKSMGAAFVFAESLPGVRFCEDPDMKDIMVLYPDGFTEYYSCDFDYDGVLFADRIVASVLDRMSAMKIPDGFSFSDVKLSVLKSRSDEARELCSLYEDELSAKDFEIRQLRGELEDQKGRVHALQCRVDGMRGSETGSGGVSLACGEEDLYPGEVKDVVLRVLSDAMKDMPDDLSAKQSRKYHVLASLLDLNARTDVPDEIRSFFKGAMKSGTMNKKELSEMEKYGFTYRRTENHIHVTYKEDPRYAFVMSSSPSDVCSGKNFCMAYMNMLFGY